MADRQSTTRSKMIEVYRATDSIFGRPYCKIGPEDSAAWVDQGLACWCKNGKAVQLTETVAERFDTKSSAITNLESEANAGLVKQDGCIASARNKVKAWPSVGSDPVFGSPTKAPLPAQPGGIRTISGEELERLSAGIGQPLLESAGRIAPRGRSRLPSRRKTTRPVDNALLGDEFVQQYYSNDEQEYLNEKVERLSGVPNGCHEVEGGEVDT